MYILLFLHLPHLFALLCPFINGIPVSLISAPPLCLPAALCLIATACNSISMKSDFRSMPSIDLLIGRDFFSLDSGISRRGQAVDTCGGKHRTFLLVYTRKHITYTGADLGILRGGGGFWAGILRGGGDRVQVHGNFHILTSQKKTKKTSGGGGGVNPLPPPGSATAYRPSTLSAESWDASVVEIWRQVQIGANGNKCLTALLIRRANRISYVNMLCMHDRGIQSYLPSPTTHRVGPIPI